MRLASEMRPATGRELSVPAGILVDNFRQVLVREGRALQDVIGRLETQGCAIGLACGYLSANGRATRQSRTIVSGVGKAGYVAQKIAATLSSTGTPASYLHPTDALHGDLGLVREGDCALLFSYSGETVELVRLAIEMRNAKCGVVAVTRSARSRLGVLASVCIELGEIVEACPLGLAPTASSTAMLAVGDALALTIAFANGFDARDFARNHPAGEIGLRFRPVTDVMRTGDRFVSVHGDAPVLAVIQMITRASTAAAVISDGTGEPIGIFTDGDLRRAVVKYGEFLTSCVRKFASFPCKTISAAETLADAMQRFREFSIEELPVVEPSNGDVVGLLCLKDIELI